MRRKSQLGQQMWLPELWREIEERPSSDKWLAYQQEFKNNTDDFSYYTGELADKSGYTATILSAKPDPLGRNILMDLRMYGQYRGSGRTLLPLAGDPQYTVYASVTYSGNRAHGSPGARVHRTGLGVVAYAGNALNAKVWASHDNIYSPSPNNSNHDRTDEADMLWESMNASGLAYQSSATSTETVTRSHCVNVEGDDIEIEDSEGNWYDGTITTDEICGRVEVEYEAESGSNDYLDPEAIFKTGLVVCGISRVDKRLTYLHDSSWTPVDGGYAQIKDLRNPPYHGEFLDGYLKFDANEKIVVSQPTAELVARSHHGPSIGLILYMADLIKRSAGEELMLGYLRRLDISHAAASNAKYLELLGQQRLPGISGVSLGGIRAIQQAHFGVAAVSAQGKLMIDMDEENPLHLPKLSSGAKRLMEKLPND